MKRYDILISINLLFTYLFRNTLIISAGGEYTDETIILAEAWGLQCYGEYRRVWDASWIPVSHNARDNERTRAMLR